VDIKFDIKTGSQVAPQEFTALQAVVVALDVISPGFRCVIYLGTQVSLETQVSRASAVLKVEGDNTTVLVVGQYPFLASGYEAKNVSSTYDCLTVKGNLEKIFKANFFTEDELQRVCLLLQGRPRFVATFIYYLVAGSKQFHTTTAINKILNTRTLIEEIKRILALQTNDVGVDHLIAIWSSYLKIAHSSEDECMVPLSLSGTLAFTRNIKCTIGRKKYSNSVEIENSKSNIEFDHIIMEPLLIHSIEKYIVEKSQSTSHANSRMYEYCKQQMLSQTNASVRGTLLDTVVLTKFICNSHLTPMDLKSSFPGVCKTYDDYKYQLHRIVSGVCGLSRWVNLICTDPDAEILPGLRARNAAVEPETNAGADCVFAAFKNNEIVFVSFSCTWRGTGTKAVTKGKVAKQGEKSDLHNQFESASSTGQLADRKEMILNALDSKRRAKFLRVLIELPNRPESSPAASTTESNDCVYIINKDNVRDILGFDSR
jgi:hypothetical protein